MSPAAYVRSVNGRRAAAEALGTFFLVPHRTGDDTMI
jgi:hypothetical protein